jgi:hypothetical protein
MKKRFGRLSVIAVIVLVLAVANFLRVFFGTMDRVSEPWLVESVWVTHPLAMIAMLYLIVKHADDLPRSRWLRPIGYRHYEDPEESITLQNPPAAPRDHEKQDQDGP